MDEESRRKIVKILKELQLDSMGVDLATPPEDNVEYLTDKLHWAEVQIEALIDSYSREARVDTLQKLIPHTERWPWKADPKIKGLTMRDWIPREIIDAELKALGGKPEGKPNE